MNRTSVCITAFIAGAIKIKHLDRKFKERIDKIITASPPILPPVYAPTSPRKTWPWPKRRTTPGTLGNVIELLGRKKKSAVFVNKAKEFMTVGDVAPLLRRCCAAVA